ncbi:MAG: NAD-dependent epimerase/dehydratase family protein [Tunicatimonas sp.]
MQVILGSGGAIGTELALALPRYTSDIRLVSRDPKQVNNTDELFEGDLTDADRVAKAVQGAEVAYLAVGLPYNTAVWRSTWPVVMANVINACKQHNVKLVFFDNVYMYDPQHVTHMTEDTPVNPSSNKGKVRRQIADQLMHEVRAGNITALIARSADFYGPPQYANQVLNETVYKNLKQGKKANWLGSDQYKHAFTYTPDAGRATALLGNTADAYGQVWHLPTADNPPTGKAWIEAFAREMNVAPKSQVAGKTLVKVIGWFNPVMRELHEMLYQYDRDYVFDSSKFDKRFDFQKTSYEEGIRQVVATGA